MLGYGFGWFRLVSGIYWGPKQGKSIIFYISFTFLSKGSKKTPYFFWTFLCMRSLRTPPKTFSKNSPENLNNLKKK
jgi:hypothetical protein